jgi:hypothetical protein
MDRVKQQFFFNSRGWKSTRSVLVSLLLVASWSGIASSVWADTAVVCIRTPDRIVIGADSKGTFRGAGNSNAPICKIRQVGDVFYAAAGILQHPGTGFVVWNIVDEALRGGFGIADKMTVLEDSAKLARARALSALKTVHPDDYEENFNKGDRAVLSIVFGTREKGELRVWSVDFQIATADPFSFNVHRKSCPGTCEDGNSIYFLGQKESMLAYYDSHPQLQNSKFEEIVDTLIGVAMLDKSDQVGPPVDILQVTPKGAEWVRNGKGCPEIRRPAK